MNGVTSFAVLCFSSLFTMINPLGVAPVFATLTAGDDAGARRRSVMRATSVALAVLMTFALGGGLIFRMFGITINAFRIAGGILFFAMAMPMILGHRHEEPGEVGGDPAIVPLGIPLICGPGTISTVMVLMGQSRSSKHVLALVAAIVLSLLVTALTLLVAPPLLRRLGSGFVAVATRVMGLIVCVIGIQFVLDGVKPVAIEILSAAARR
jgi:multiple antibiotic resistance protein